MDRQDEQQRYQDQSQRVPGQRQSGQGTSPASDAVGGYAIVDIWTFTLPETLGSTDVTGYSVEATDGGIGKVDEATKESGSSYLIVDTGPWIFGKKVMLPAGVVTRVDHNDKKVYVDRAKDEIKNAPQYDPERGHQDREYRGRLGEYYGSRSARR
jgi:hypothetical protein